MRNNENKIYDQKKFSQSCFVYFCTEEMQYFAQAIKNIGYQAFYEYSAD